MPAKDRGYDRSLKISALTFIAEAVSAASDDDRIGEQIIAEGAEQLLRDGRLFRFAGFGVDLVDNKRRLLLFAFFVRRSTKNKR